MKYKLGLAILVIIATGLFGRHMLKHDNSPPAAQPGTPAKIASVENDQAIKDKDNRAAAKYIESFPKGAVLLDESDPESQDDIDGWEGRIHDYVQEHALTNIDENHIHSLALKTASLFRMLQAATQRQNKGQEPYTSVTGFNTMTLVMAMEKEYQEALGITFSDYLNTLDAALIKGLVEP